MTRAFLLTYKDGGAKCAVQSESGAEATPKDQGATAAGAATMASRERDATCGQQGESGAKAAPKDQIGLLGGPDTRSRKAKSRPGGKPGGIEQED
jgi:hypothetical protein